MRSYLTASFSLLFVPSTEGGGMEISMIDLHTHILPGVDDGSQTLEDSLEMAEIALEGGVDTIIATPHSNQMGRFENFYDEKLEARFEQLKSVLKQERIPVTLYTGMEIYASEDMGEKIKQGFLISINHSRYYLVEFNFGEVPERMELYLEDIFQAGGVPLIAHPERYYCVQDNPSLVYQWLQRGCYAQINKGSLFGRFGRHADIAAHILLQNDWVTCVASDAHSPFVRTTFMGDVRDYLEEQFGDDVMYRLTTENPRRIIENKDIPVHGNPPVRRRRYW